MEASAEAFRRRRIAKSVGEAVRWAVPSIFPHEEWFMVGVGGLIALLLVLRFRLTRRRRANPQMTRTSEAPDPADQQPRSFDL